MLAEISLFTKQIISYANGGQLSNEMIVFADK